jgi:hypothetical protein
LHRIEKTEISFFELCTGMLSRKRKLLTASESPETKKRGEPHECGYACGQGWMEHPCEIYPMKIAHWLDTPERRASFKRIVPTLIPAILLPPLVQIIFEYTDVWDHQEGRWCRQCLVWHSARSGLCNQHITSTELENVDRVFTTFGMSNADFEFSRKFWPTLSGTDLAFRLDTMAVFWLERYNTFLHQRQIMRIIEYAAGITQSNPVVTTRANKAAPGAIWAFITLFHQIVSSEWVYEDGDHQSEIDGVDGCSFGAFVKLQDKLPYWSASDFENFLSSGPRTKTNIYKALNPPSGSPPYPKPNFPLVTRLALVLTGP